MSQQLVIIGNSAAGLTAAETFRSIDPESPLTMICREEGAAYSRVLTPYLISGERADIRIRAEEHYRRLRIRTLFGRAASAVEGREVVLEGGGRIPFDRLLIATGSRAAQLDVPGIDARGVFVLKDRADALAIRNHLEAGRRAVILGGGLICLLVIRALRKLGFDLHVVVSSERLLSRMLDEEAAGMLESRLLEQGVRISTATDVGEIAAPGGAVQAAVTTDGRELPADIVIVAKGIRSNVDLASAGIPTGRGILVDQYMRTGREDVFAAGDCAESPDLIIRGKKTICATWFEAVHQGEIAACNMAGLRRPTMGSLKMNVMAVLGTPVASIGVFDTLADERSIVSRNGDRYRRLVLRGDRLVGAVLAGDVREAGLLAALIRRRIPLSSRRGLDLESGMRYLDVLPRRPRARIGEPVAAMVS